MKGISRKGYRLWIRDMDKGLGQGQKSKGSLLKYLPVGRINCGVNRKRKRRKRKESGKNHTYSINEIRGKETRNEVRNRIKKLKEGEKRKKIKN